jgi:hypothetical protein
LTVTRVAQRSGLRRVLAEIGVRGHREATRESARNFRLALEELGTTFIGTHGVGAERSELIGVWLRSDAADRHHRLDESEPR